MLEVRRAELDLMIAHAERVFPHECCGILVGRREGTTNRVDRVFEAVNVVTVRSHDRFEMDPRSILEADDWARGRGLEVVGFYHSHPDHPPIASATDNEWARPGWHDGYSFLILSIRRGRYAEGKSWTLGGDRLVEEPFQTT